MGKEQRRHFTGQEKVAILRRHLVEKVPVSDLCEEHGLHPTVFYRWQKDFFEQGAVVFDAPKLSIPKNPYSCYDKELRIDRQPSAFVVREANPRPHQLGLENPVPLLEVRDHVLLMPIHPVRDGHEQQLPSLKSVHGRDSGRLRPPSVTPCQTAVCARSNTWTLRARARGCLGMPQ